jgi:hypothetical protein
LACGQRESASSTSSAQTKKLRNLNALFAAGLLGAKNVNFLMTVTGNKYQNFASAKNVAMPKTLFWHTKMP